MNRVALTFGLAVVGAGCQPVRGMISDSTGARDAGAAAQDASDLVYDDGGGAAVDAAAEAAPDSGPIADTTASCDPSKIWSAGASLPLTTSAATFGAIDGSETTVAWITTSDDVVHYADRDDATSPWGADQTIASGFAPGERVAVQNNGLALYAIGADHRSIVSFERAQIGDAFSVGAGAALANVNDEIAALPNGTTVSDVVLSPSSTLLVLRWVGGSSAGLRIARRVMLTDTWPTTSAFAVQSETAVVNGKARRPTGISVDGRALFYWDETTSSETVGFFAWDATTMSQFTSLGSRADAQVNTDCSALYYDDGSGNLETAPHN